MDRMQKKMDRDVVELELNELMSISGGVTFQGMRTAKVAGVIFEKWMDAISAGERIRANPAARMSLEHKRHYVEN
jgi:hypothetical protein